MANIVFPTPENSDWRCVFDVAGKLARTGVGQDKFEIIYKRRGNDQSSYPSSTTKTWTVSDNFGDLLQSAAGHTQATHISGHGLVAPTVDEQLESDMRDEILGLIQALNPDDEDLVEDGGVIDFVHQESAGILDELSQQTLGEVGGVRNG